MEENTSMLTPDERLTILSDNILSSVIHKTEEDLHRRVYLFGQLPVRAFRNENYIIYFLFTQLKDKGITPDLEFFKLYLMRNTKLLSEHAVYLNMDEYADMGEDLNVSYIGAICGQYSRLLEMEPLDFDTFKLEIEKYKTEYSAIEMNKAYTQARLMLYDEQKIGRDRYQGFADSVAYIKQVAGNIENMLDNTIGDGFIDSRLEGTVDKMEAKPSLVCNFDLLDELNKELTGIYSGFLYNVIAPTKGGKSKFTTRLAHTAMVQYGQNISVWAFEGGYEAWWAQLRAIHFEYLYIRNKVGTERVAPISQATILKDDFPSDEIRRMEAASREDLFKNPDYGVVNMINRPFEVESFIDELNTSVRNNRSKMVIVDYLQLIGSCVPSKNTVEVVREAYQKALRFTKDMNVAFVTPAQFKQDFIKEMSSYKGEKSPETRTSGGESSEVIRSSDVNIALYASVDDLTRGEMTVMSIPSRIGRSFPSFKIYADLCSCVFSSLQSNR